jgi:malonyl-CoA/methylmalonyl-CoA synthetase
MPIEPNPHHGTTPAEGRATAGRKDTAEGKAQAEGKSQADGEDPAEWLAGAARSRPDRLFLREPGGRELTYAALHEQTRRFAAAFRARGVAHGDRVAVQVDKSVDAVLLYLACLQRGAVFVPINTANTAREVDYFLRDSEPRLAVIRPADRPLLEPLAAAAKVRHLETLGVRGDGSLAELVRSSAAAACPPRQGGSQSLAAIVYTSGTTGRSKGAMLTRANLAANAAVLADAWRFTENDVLLHTLPLFHVHGLMVAINTVLASRSSLVLLPRFDAAAVLEHLPSATVYMGVPTHYTRLLKEPALERAATGMRLFISGSAPLLAETHAEFARRTGHLILERYGMTETLMNSSNPYEGPRVPGSVGPPLPGVAIRVSRPAGGPAAGGPAAGGPAAGDPAAAAAGAVGEAAAAAGADAGTAGTGGAEAAIGNLEVKGPNVFAGYWNDAEKTRAEFTADGWFKTGDVGHIDAAGYVHIVGRAKDLVITGGYNVYPKEVELELDALTGVLESAVFGVPHPDFGEAVTAAVVRSPAAALSEAAIIAAVKPRLAGYKIPKRIIFIDELPRNAMGKVQKNALRATYAALYRGAQPSN